MTQESGRIVRPPPRSVGLSQPGKFLSRFGAAMSSPCPVAFPVGDVTSMSVALARTLGLHSGGQSAPQLVARRNYYR